LDPSASLWLFFLISWVKIILHGITSVVCFWRYGVLRKCKGQRLWFSWNAHPPPVLTMRINMVRVPEGSSSCYNETFFFGAERSYNCICYSYFWWVRDLGNSSSLHTRRWAEEGWEANGGSWVEKLSQSAFCCWVLAPSWNQEWEKETHQPSCPKSKDLSSW